MKAQSTLFALVLTGTAIVAGCSSKEEPKEEPRPQPSATAAPSATVDTPAAKPSTSLIPESSVPGIAARVKMEVDGKEPDAGARGTTIAAGKATFAAPAGWTGGKSGIWTTAVSADKKSSFAAGNYAATDTATAKLPEAATALGYSDCQWASTETVTVGKDKVAGVAADGVCKQNGASVKTAYIAFDSMKVLAIGGWADGGDDAGVFSTFRHTKGVAGGGSGDSTGLKACCDALAQNAGSAPPEQKGSYLAAAATCRSLISNPQGRALLGQVRAMLAGANAPASCQ